MNSYRMIAGVYLVGLLASGVSPASAMQAEDLRVEVSRTEHAVRRS